MKLSPTAEFPRSYTISVGWKVFTLIAGAAFMALGLLGVWFFAGDAKSPAAALFLQAVSLAFAAFGVLAIMQALRYEVVLTSESIEVRDLFKVRALRVVDIAGRRTLRVPNSPSSIELVPRDGSEKTLKIAQTVRFDGVFEEWLAGIPDQDMIDEQELQQGISANPMYGITPQERQGRLAKMRALVRTLGVVGFGVTLWGFVYPYPYGLVIAALITCPVIGVAVAMTSKGLVQIDQHAHDKRPSVVGIVISPAIVLAFRAFIDVQLVGWQPAVFAGFVGGVLLVFVIARAEVKARRWPALFLFLGVIGFPYSYGTIVELNTLLDSHPAQKFYSEVLDKHETTGRHHFWYFTMTAWGAIKEARQVSVSRHLYEQAEVGDTVCVVQQKGALGIEWFWISPRRPC